MSSDLLSDYRWLTSDAARPYLEQAAADEKLTALARQLRRELTQRQVHLVLEQAELRRRGRAKFSLAERMFFTARALQQATDERIAAYKASRFPPQQLVADLCCGIGGDLLGLAARGPVIGVESDACVALLAEANCRAVQAREASVLVQQAERFTPPDGIAWHIDPDRRAAGSRTVRPDRFSPPEPWIESWRARHPNGAVKLAPASKVSQRWAADAEREWIGDRGECKQQVAWFGQLARHPGLHVATVVSRGAEQLIGRPGLPTAIATNIGDFVFDPHPAVLAAGLVGELARRFDLEALGAQSLYLTGSRPIASPLLQAFHVLEVLPLNRKRLRTWIGQHGIGQLEIKVRGVDCSPERLRAELRPRGDRPATLIVYRSGRQAKVIAAERIEASN